MNNKAEQLKEKKKEGSYQYVKRNEFQIGKDLVDIKYTKICGNFHVLYDECLKDTFGDRFKQQIFMSHKIIIFSVSCKHLRKSIKYCEEQNGYFEEVHQKLNIQPQQMLYKKYPYGNELPQTQINQQ